MPGGRRAPQQTATWRFGGVAAGLGILQVFGVAAIIDEITSRQQADAGAFVGVAWRWRHADRLVARRRQPRGLVEAHCRDQSPSTRPSYWSAAGLRIDARRSRWGSEIYPQIACGS